MDLADFISSEGEDTEEEQGRTPSSDVKKKASLSGFGRRLVAVASTVGGAIARSAEAAAEVKSFGLPLKCLLVFESQLYQCVLALSLMVQAFCFAGAG